MARRRRVVLDCTSAAKRIRGGIQRYVVNLVQALRALDTDLEFVVGLRASHYLDRRLLLDLAPDGPRIMLPLLHGGGDLLHGLGVRMPFLHPGLPTVVTIHDLGVFDVPHLYRPKWVQGRRLRIEQSLARADGAAVYAAYTKERIRQYIPQFTGPIRVTPLGVDHCQFHAEPEEEDQAAVAALGIERPFVLQVGALAPRKKPEVTLEAFALLNGRGDFQLVLPGLGKAEAVAKLKELAARLGIEDAVVLPGFVPDELLPRLYRRCSAFVFSSEYEGFGLPIVEAMACGAPVIVALTSCIGEVAGDAALSVSSGNVEELAGALERILGDTREAARLSDRGIARSRDFTWQRTAEETVALYREFLPAS